MNTARIAVPEFADHLRAMNQAWALLKHLRRGWKQFRRAPQIGEMQTPVVSFWPLLRKFERIGWLYETTGLDGDTRMATSDDQRQNRFGLIQPKRIRLVYVRFRNWGVLQIAYWY